MKKKTASKTIKQPTQFQVKVYKELLKIPSGEVRTYKQIAQAIDKPKASRAVGMACNKNPYPIIVPCHRVVGSNGSLTGYAFGLKFKEELLKLEAEKKSTAKVVKEIEDAFGIKFATKIENGWN